ncbi:MAG: enoyl-CoA hydratase/isomerase family protein [Chloroflexi bacterium]|nr:enoyl-CoA hydratase/isomerase family protein [Chloroflexota bacterium]MBL7162625.1 enoyl-CoA hydratase/isomerase family protein [Anaerolineales bacterium]
METILVEYQDTVGIIKLNRGVTNTINLQLVEEFQEVLQEIESDPNTHSLVITSTIDKFFSIGFDIPNLFDLPQDEFEIFYHAFNFTFR